MKKQKNSWLQIQMWKSNHYLRTPSSPITKITKEHKELAKQMSKLMRSHEGVWIAAPQVGVNERIAIITHRKKDKKGEYQFINEEVVVNPLIVSKSDALRESAEGCLSLPGIEGNVMRHQEVKISYQNLKGEFKTAKLKEFDAAIIQHEIDHLNGVLFVDKME